MFKRSPFKSNRQHKPRLRTRIKFFWGNYHRVLFGVLLVAGLGCGIYRLNNLDQTNTASTKGENDKPRNDKPRNDTTRT